MERGKYVMVALFIGYLSLVNAHRIDSNYLSASASVTSNDGNHCSFRANFINDGGSIRLDRCVMCTCDNGTTFCVITSCPLKYSCDESELVFFPSLCCKKCPYKIYVKKTTNLYNGNLDFTQGDTIKINFDIDIAIARKPTSESIRGIGMWKLSAWISPNSDGTGNRFSVQDNVFSTWNTKQQYSKPDYPPWIWSDLSYTMQFTGASCSEYNYFCVKFNRGDNPRPDDDLPFTFQAVDNEESRLIGCVPLGHCSGCLESEGWTTFNGHCYKLTKMRGNHSTISDTCATMGHDAGYLLGNTDLAWIESEEENTFVSDVIAKRRWSWIGGKRQVDSNFAWFREGSVAGYFDEGFTFWKPGQPDNPLNQEVCVVTNRGGTSKWSDIKCLRHLPGICKYSYME